MIVRSLLGSELLPASPSASTAPSATGVSSLPHQLIGTFFVNAAAIGAPDAQGAEMGAAPEEGGLPAGPGYWRGDEGGATKRVP